jgi:precorrin-6B methylase 2
MTRDDIIRMARGARFTNPERFDTDDENLRGILEDFWANLERFAALVAAAEREECAKAAETIQEFGLNVATAIRARGQA